MLYISFFYMTYIKLYAISALYYVIFFINFILLNYMKNIILYYLI